MGKHNLNATTILARAIRQIATDNQPTKPKMTSDKFGKAADGFQNVAARLGYMGAGQGEGKSNNLLSGGDYTFDFITRNFRKLEAMYRGSWVIGKVVDGVAKDMTRAGIDITSTKAAEQIDDLQSEIADLCLWQSICSLIKWGRLYGGAIAVMQIEGQDPATPLDASTVGKGQFTGLSVYDRWQLSPDLNNVIQSGHEIGLPAFYTIINTQDLIVNSAKSQIEYKAGANYNGVRVHHSRILRHVPVELPYFQAISEQKWGQSVIERMMDRLVAFDTATMSSANLINRAHLRTVGIEGLREILSAGGAGEENLLKMFEYMRMFQSSEGLTVLDKEDEYKSDKYSFAGLSDMMLQFGQQIAGATGYPLVKLFGQAPAGLNSTGESDIRNYYDEINMEQNSSLRPGWKRMLPVVYASKFGKPMPEDMQFKFTTLWQVEAKDRADVGQKSTATILAAYDDGVIDKPTAMKELKQGSKETGLFTNITDEQIDDAENELPAPGESPPIPGQPDPTGTVSPQDPKRLPGEPKIPKAEVAAGPESKPDPDDAPKIPRKATKGILGKLKKYAGN